MSARIVVYAIDPEDRKLAAAFERSLPPECGLELAPLSGFSRSFRKKVPGAMVYLEAAGLEAARLAELEEKLREIEGCAWGVIDRGGEIGDPASLFFRGASDYLGPHFFRAGRALGAERLAAALASAGLAPAPVEAPRAFPGWSGLEAGAEVSVRFCYAAVAGQGELLERIGEKRLHKLREDFASFLGKWSAECGGIVWIKESTGCLVLFPPGDEGMNPVLAAFRLLLDRALVGYEVFALETPLSFRFAFHTGSTMWRPPGATGTVVSEDVNFIFHLGSKTPSDGAILVSSDAERSIPAFLRDLFSPAGDFEGRPISSSRRLRD
jgi:class 3 adenylate cyclase